MGEGVVRYWPITNSFILWVFLPLCQFWWKSIKKCDRESAHRRTHTHRDWQTQTDFIICPMLYAIAMVQIIRLICVSHRCILIKICPYESIRKFSRCLVHRLSNRHTGFNTHSKKLAKAETWVIPVIYMLYVYAILLFSLLLIY